MHYGSVWLQVPTDVQELAERYVQRKSSGEVRTWSGLPLLCCIVTAAAPPPG